MRPRLAALAALALAVLACAPAAASAARDDEPSAKKLIRIELEGTNDYSISIVSSPRQFVTVLATKEGVGERLHSPPNTWSGTPLRAPTG